MWTAIRIFVHKSKFPWPFWAIGFFSSFVLLFIQINGTYTLFLSQCASRYIIYFVVSCFFCCCCFCFWVRAVTSFFLGVNLCTPFPPVTQPEWLSQNTAYCNRKRQTNKLKNRNNSDEHWRLILCFFHPVIYKLILIIF